jgi:hypothetical protein
MVRGVYTVVRLSCGFGAAAGGLSSARTGALLRSAMVLVVAGAVLGACSYGAAEFQLYTKAFDAQYEQGQRVLDSVAVAERIVVTRSFKENPRRPAFSPARAAYYLDNVDPPITASIRASLKSLKAYNEALASLANGEAAEAFTNRVGTLATNVVAAAAAASIAASGRIAIAGADKLVGDSAGYLAEALPYVKAIAVFASREAFKRELSRTYPAMKGLVLTLRDGTPAMFLMLRQSRTNVEQDFMSAESLAVLKKDREALAGWVLLLDQTLVAMDAAVEAVLSNATSADLATLTEASVELRVLAEKMKANRLR